MKNMKKILVLALAALLLVAVSIGGTIAYLTAQSAQVENTFTPTGIGVTLTETGGTDFKLIPGKTYDKDPVVAVADTTNVDIWLYVQIVDESAAQYLSTYDCTLYEGADKAGANGWTKGNGTDIPSNVYYRAVGDNDEIQSWALIAGDTITVSTELGGANMAMPSTNTKLTYKAYAVQKDNVTVEAGWTLVAPATNP